MYEDFKMSNKNFSRLDHMLSTKHSRSTASVLRLVTKRSERETKMLSCWVIMKIEKLQILKIYDGG